GRYAPEGAVQEALDGLLAAGHLNREGDVLVPSDGMRHVLQVAEHARGQAAASLWSDDAATHAGEPIPAVMAAAKITDGLLASQLKAPEWPDAPHRLFQRLSRMRYLRNDSHAAAWSAHGLTAGEMVVFTQLWRDQELRDDPAALAALSERGLAHDGHISDAGRALREQIEDDTNANDAVAYAALDPAHRVAWLETLDSLPRFEA
ncbi:MAG: hypothetical protein HKO87_08445, partial [Acidimicrobiia bacterium]|nr:hypothetical protein [Acidimicrobiia bacterium]